MRVVVSFLVGFWVCVWEVGGGGQLDEENKI